MKTYQNLILLVSIGLLSCHQNKPNQAGAKKLDLKTTVINKTIQDTLIFKDPSLVALIKHAEKIFSVFDTISPFNDYDIRKFKFSKADVDTLYRYNTNDSVPNIHTMHGSSITATLSSIICYDLEKILSWKDIDQYDLRLLLKNHIGVARSPDGKLYSFGFGEQTGGTYKSVVRYIHYKVDNNNSITINDLDETVFNPDAYDSIDTINTKEGIKYLLKGYVQGCSQCFGYYIDLVHFDKGKFIKDFSYNVSSRRFEGKDEDTTNFITYDAKQHTITIRYITDDQTPTCNCGKNGSIGQDRDEENHRTSDITCVYKFNGKTFVLKNKKSKRVKS